MMPTHTMTLPQIRISDFEVLKPDWDAGVKALGDNIPGYRYSASRSPQIIYLCSRICFSLPLLYMLPRCPKWRDE